MVLCVDPGLSNKVADLSFLLGFTGITITNCSQYRTQRRLIDIKVSLNHSSSEQNQRKSRCQDFTSNLTATGWFTCKTDTKRRHTLNQEPPQVSKILILISDRRIVAGVSGLRIRMFPLPNNIDATWSDSSPNGMKANKCYMEIQLHNSTVEDLTDQNRYLCTKKNCNCVVKRGVANDTCYRDASNYLEMTIQEQNCVLEIIWLTLFPTICIILLIIISYQLLKEDSSCNARSCGLGSDYLQGEYDNGSHLMSGESSRQYSAIYVNDIQQEGSRRQSPGYEAFSREHQFISGDQGEDGRRHEAAAYINENQQEESRIQSPGYEACSREYQYIENVQGVKNSSKKHVELSTILELKRAHSNNGGHHFITLPPDNSKGQNSDSASADVYKNIDSATDEASATHHHPSGANSRQHESPEYTNEIRQEGRRRQPLGHKACSKENQHVEPVIVYQGTCNTVHIYDNIEEPNSEAAPSRQEYANFLDLAVDEAFLTSQHLSDALDLHRNRHHNIKAATWKKKRKFLCF